MRRRRGSDPSRDDDGRQHQRTQEDRENLSRFGSIIGFFGLMTTGIVLSVGKSTMARDAATTDNHRMEPIGPQKLERFLCAAMTAGLLWMFVNLLCPNFLIEQTTNQDGSSRQHMEGNSMKHILVFALLLMIGAATLPLINFVAFLINPKCYRDEIWGGNPSEWVFYRIWHSLFIIIQPIFFFKYVQHGARLKFCRGLSHFVLMWLMGTNISLWLHFVLEELSADDEGPFILPHKSLASGLTYGMTTSTRPNVSSSNTSCPASLGPLPEIRRLLQPFVLEYSLISAGLFLILWSRVCERQTEVGDHECSVRQTDRLPQQTTSLNMPMVSGLILGVVLVLILVVLMYCHYTKLNGLGIKTNICNDTVAEIVISQLNTAFGWYYGYSIFMSVIILLGCLIVLYSPMKKIMQPEGGGARALRLLQSFHDDTDSQHRSHIWIDTALLISSAAGAFLINGFGMAAAAGLTNYHACGYISQLYLADCALGAINCVAQLLLIMGALHQQWEGTKRRNFVFSCLFIINFGIWGSDLFEVKNITTTALGQIYFGSSVWYVVIHIAYPLCMFFRLHSAATLYPLMKKSYRINNGGHPEYLPLTGI